MSLCTKEKKKISQTTFYLMQLEWISQSTKLRIEDLESWKEQGVRFACWMILLCSCLKQFGEVIGEVQQVRHHSILHFPVKEVKHLIFRSPRLGTSRRGPWCLRTERRSGKLVELNDSELLLVVCLVIGASGWWTWGGRTTPWSC